MKKLWLALAVSFLCVLLLPSPARTQTAVQDWVQRYKSDGNNSDRPSDVAVDGDNNVVVAGSAGSNSDRYITTIKYSSAGTPLWTNLFNAAIDSNDDARSVAVDSLNNVIVGGHSGFSMFVVIKFSPDGNSIWTNRFAEGEGKSAQINAASLDANDNVIVTGVYAGDFVTIKYASSGTALWTNRYGSSTLSEVPNAIAVDDNNDIIVTGIGGSPLGHGLDYLTLKYSSSGTLLWTNRLNAARGGHDIPKAIAVDSEGNVIVTGQTDGPSRLSFGTIKYSTGGVPIWTNYYDGESLAFAHAVAIDANDSVFVTGYHGPGGEENYATVAYSKSGMPLWTNVFSFPTRSTDVARDIKIDHNGNVIVSGDAGGTMFGGTNFATIRYSNSGVPLSTNVYNGPFNGSDSVAALALDNNGDIIVTGLSQGGVLDVDYATVKLLSPPIILNAGYTNGILQMEMRPPNKAIIEMSTDLVGWMPIYTNATATNLLHYSDPQSGEDANRFYRAKRLP